MDFEQQMKQVYNKPLKLNGVEQNKDDDLTVIEVLSLLAVFELSKGTTQIGVEKERIKGKVEEYKKKLKRERTIEELIDQVKRNVHPKN